MLSLQNKVELATKQTDRVEGFNFETLRKLLKKEYKIGASDESYLKSRHVWLKCKDSEITMRVNGHDAFS